MANGEKQLAGQIAEQLQARILSGEWKAGDRLPTEMALMEENGVSRSTVRAALGILRTRNIITVRQGSGAYVAENPGLTDDPLGIGFIGDREKLIHDLLFVRMTMEPAIAEQAAFHATQEDIEELDRLRLKIEDMIAAGEDYLDVDMEFHSRIARSSGNCVVPRLEPVILDAVRLFTKYTGGRLLQETIDTHYSIVDAIRRHDGFAARSAAALHISYNMVNLEGPTVLNGGTGEAPLQLNAEILGRWEAKREAAAAKQKEIEK